MSRMPFLTVRPAAYAVVLLGGALLLSLLLNTMPVARAAVLGEVQNISNDAAESVTPRVAQDPDGNVHVTWVNAQGGSARVLYAKGNWNGSRYVFGSSIEIANVGSYAFATPNVGVASDGRIALTWSEPTVRARVWNSREAGPSGPAISMGEGIQTSIAADSANRFHIVWSGDFRIQYCELTGSSCTRREAFASDAVRPTVAVDTNNNVHVVYDSRGVKYALRPAGGNWRAEESIDGGNYPQIAADGQGSVHLAWSRDFDIQYCRRTSGGGCTDRFTISTGDDLQPSIGATANGNLIVAYLDSTARAFRYTVRESGAWQTPQGLGGGAQIQVARQLYTTRGSIVWSRDFDIQHATVFIGQAPPPTPTTTPTVTPTPTRPPAPRTGVFPITNPDFLALWTRTDSLVRSGAARYSWIWGPAPFTEIVSEPYAQSPGGARQVQYFDKSRMEINRPDAPRDRFFVSNGRLADELITGIQQVGDAQYVPLTPAAIPVAGDPQNTFPLYRDLQAVYKVARFEDRANQLLFKAPDGSVRTELLPSANGDPSMVITQRVNTIGIPKIFWDFMNQSGLALEGGTVVTANPLFDWRYVIGEPLTEAYWTVVRVGGRDQGVLVQAFERRVLTYTPGNPAGFQVEMGNIGRHYFEWRYGVRP